MKQAIVTADFFFSFKLKILKFLGQCQHLEDGDGDEITSVAEFCTDFEKAPIHLQTMVSLSAPNVACPISGEFTYTYKTGNIRKCV